jgi:hypothetical protein
LREPKKREVNIMIYLIQMEAQKQITLAEFKEEFRMEWIYTLMLHLNL